MCSCRAINSGRAERRVRERDGQIEPETEKTKRASTNVTPNSNTPEDYMTPHSTQRPTDQDRHLYYSQFPNVSKSFVFAKMFTLIAPCIIVFKTIAFKLQKKI